MSTGQTTDQATDRAAVEGQRERVRARYAAAAAQAAAGEVPSCADPGCTPDPERAPGAGAAAGTSSGCGGPYAPEQLGTVPGGAAAASLGCGNPLAVAELAAGETVLDLGSGAGLDVLLSARRVGPTGFVYGLDMTPEMLELAGGHAADAGATNVEFLAGHIEAIPLPDASVDVVISNCVINLSVDKPTVFTEIARVLRPGGRLGVSDLLATDATAAADPERLAAAAASVGAITGVLTHRGYREALQHAGLDQISIVTSHRVAEGVDSAIIQARRPHPSP